MRWPLPALAVWLVCWASHFALSRAGVPAWAAIAAPITLGVLLSIWRQVASTPWRQWFVAAGFPLSSLALNSANGLPAWIWLAPLALLLLAYPLNAWRDAPVFPTPRGALTDLPKHAALPPNAHILDAGCGMGDGLAELHRAYPTAQLHGIEWGWPWRLVSALRCPWAKVTRGDMWRADWSGFDMVYLFQRPESMPRAVDKARRELKPGAWLVSLEFEAVDAQGQALKAHTRLTLEGGRPVWVYQQPL